tara:strand:+ start:1728 stop:2342 length:615 start_codon:yes stop_codon:yes gene_type:complete
MALQSSSTISLNDIAGEFGAVNGTPHSLSEYYRGGGAVPDSAANSNIPTSGTIQFSNFYGGANITVLGQITVNSLGTTTFSSGKNTQTTVGVCSRQAHQTPVLGSWGDANADATNSLCVAWYHSSNSLVGSSVIAGDSNFSGLAGSTITTPNGSSNSIGQIGDGTVSILVPLGIAFVFDNTTNQGIRYGFNTVYPVTGTSIFSI